MNILTRITPFWLLLLFTSCSTYTHTVRQVPQAALEQQLKTNDSTIMLAAGPHYNRGKLHTFLYGKHYRKAWATPVPVRVLNLEQEGLTAVKQGGSRQTLNLRLADSAGREYVLRSVDKEPAVGLPQGLQQSYIAMIARDATSATHPYAALTLPPMAKAIGIHYTRPQLVYIPHSQNFGEYEGTFSGMMAMLERRPDGNQTDAPWFGSSEYVKSTGTMLNDRFRDNDTEIDARFFLRSRLFDMLLGDWSRHEGNWRWAQYALDKGVNYKAVPRDRDNVFYKLNDAPIPMLFMATKLKQHFRTYRKKIYKVEALNRSGRNLDELLLSELTLTEWLQEADAVQTLLTDEVIARAFQEMPDTIYTLTAAPIMQKLKARRDQLPQVAKAYYAALSEELDVVGTDKHEEFVVEFLNDEQVRLTAYKILKDGTREQKLFERVLCRKETKVLNVYGLDGNDRFQLIGNQGSGIRINLYGGAGEDRFTGESFRSKKRRVRIYDSTYRNKIEVQKNVKVKTNDNPPAQTLDANGWLLRYYLD